MLADMFLIICLFQSILKLESGPRKVDLLFKLNIFLGSIE